MPKNTPYLLKSRHGIYYFRRSIPIKPCHRREIRISLSTRDRHAASFISSMLYLISAARVQELQKLNMEQYQELRMLLRDHVKSTKVKDGKLMITGLKLFGIEAGTVVVDGAEDNDNFIKFMTETIGRLRPPESLPKTKDQIKLSHLVEIYIEYLRITQKVRNRTVMAYEATTRDLIAIIGDQNISDIDETIILTYKKTLLKLPPNRNNSNKFKDLSIVEIAEANNDATLSTQTVRNEMARASALMNFAVKRKFIEYNPIESMLPEATERDNERRVSFTHDDIKHLIENDEILRFRKDMSTYAYFLMFLAMYSGARVGELCALRPEDFFIEGEEIPHFKIRAYQAPESGVLINPKNKNSIRSIPIHKDLERLGVTNYVLSCKEMGLQRIFPELPLIRGSYGSNASKWFTAFKRRNLCNAKEDHKKKTFHSFRHTFINKLISSNIKTNTIEDIVGHRRQSKDTINANYRDPTAMREMYTAISKISYDISPSTMKKFKSIADQVSIQVKKHFADKH
jgi:integrase